MAEAGGGAAADGAEPDPEVDVVEPVPAAIEPDAGVLRADEAATPERDDAHRAAPSLDRDQRVPDPVTAKAPTNEDRVEAPAPTAPAVGASRPRGRLAVVSAVLIFLVLSGLGGAVGYGLTRYLPERWTAEAEVILDPGTVQVDRYLDTQKVLLESSTILDRAVADLPIDRDELEDDLKVFPIEASTALGINYVDEDPDLARSVVAVVLDSFMVELELEAIDVSRPIYETRIADLGAQRDGLDQRLKRLEAANAEAEAQELPPPHPAEVRRLTLESERLLARINGLEETILIADAAAATRTDAQVVTEPRVLTEPTWPKPLAFTALGLLVGSIVAAVVLFLVASRRAV